MYSDIKVYQKYLMTSKYNVCNHLYEWEQIKRND